MEQPALPFHGIQHDPHEGWTVWSYCLQYPIRCGSATDAKRVSKAMEVAYPHGGSVDYSAVDAAITEEIPANFSAKVRLH